MKSLILINRKFMEYNPLELINIIEENSINLKGLEIAINPTDEIELKYLKDLVLYVKKVIFIFKFMVIQNYH